MKVYYLHLTQADFTQSGSIWTSSTTYDLYDNTQYKNYSVTKSIYGSNLLGNNTWTGLTYTGSTPSWTTDGGRISQGKYIDYTGRIDIIGYTFDVTVNPGTDTISPYLGVYTAPVSTAYFPDEWTEDLDTSISGLTLHVDSYRYAKFKIFFNTDQSLSGINFDLFIRIEIEVPNIPTLYKPTATILNKFPEWMTMREIDNLPPVPELATPISTGGKLINATAGEWLEDLRNKLGDLHMEQFIGTASEGQLAYAYASVIQDNPFYLCTITGDNIPLAHAVDLEEFSQTTDTENVCYWDPVLSKLYTRKLYIDLVINGVKYIQQKTHIWNWFDEFGLLVDLHRLPDESNSDFKKRILDVHINKPGVALDNFKLALRRELNLWQSYSSTPTTPNSAALGATPYVYEIADLEHHSEYVNPNGLPTLRFVSLVQELADKYPTTWGNFQWDRAYWDQAGENFDAYGILPYNYDATPLTTANTKSGVGFDDDLYVYRPDEITGPTSFNLRARAKGRVKTTRTEYPAATFDIEVWGTGNKTIFTNTPVAQWFTVKLVVPSSDATPVPLTYYHSFQLTATSDADVLHASGTPNSYVAYQIFGENGFTASGLDWFKSDGTFMSGSAATPFTINVTSITSINLYAGRFNPGTQTVNLDLPLSDTFDTWFSNAPSTLLRWNNSPIAGTGYPGIVMKPKVFSSATSTWSSEHQSFSIKVNGASPATTQVQYDLPMPQIVWDPNLRPYNNRAIIVKITTLDSTGQAVANTVNAAGTGILLAKTSINLNGASNWDSSGQMTIVDTTPTLTFTIGSDANYPITASVWEMFENVQTVQVPGYVDENGPWRNGQAPPIGNTNFNFTTLSLTRDSFGISNSPDYVVTWMGTEVISNPKIITWLDTNTVKPVALDNTVTYPNNAIQEHLDGVTGRYYYDPFTVKVKLVPGPDQQWDPKLHSGWFYDHQDEYYLYAQDTTETFATPNYALRGIARQGAPIIVQTNEATPKQFRQIAFWDDDNSDYSLTETEIVNGNGTTTLYLAYDDVYGVVATDLNSGKTITVSTSSTTNAITVNLVTEWDRQYQVKYKVNRSFFADHLNLNISSTPTTKLHLSESTPFNNYTVHYEGSTYDPATPVDLPLNGLYTSIAEGFIYIDYKEYAAGAIEVRLSPSSIVADGSDYMLVSIRSYDANGNPKPNQTINLSTSFGTLANTSIRTDRDGFAVTTLTAASSASALTGTITVSPVAVGIYGTPQTVHFNITPLRSNSYRLIAKSNVDQIPSDGTSQVSVFGRVEDGSLNPVPFANVRWRKGRSMYEVFTTYYMGEVRSDSSGNFTIGPFTSATPNDPGYWFVSAESWYAGATPLLPSATPSQNSNTSGATPYATLYPYESTPTHSGHKVGDVVFWYEYPTAGFGVETTNNLPKQPVQWRTETQHATPYSYYNSYPVTYDDATPNGAATPSNSLKWISPQWYAINRYKQYQLGLLGTGFYTVDFVKFNDAHPDYKDL